MTQEDARWHLRGTLADHAMCQLYKERVNLVNQYGHDTAIAILQWQIDRVRDMKEKLEDEFFKTDDEELELFD